MILLQNSATNTEENINFLNEFFQVSSITIIISSLSLISLVPAFFSTCLKNYREDVSFIPSIYVSTKYLYNKFLKNAFIFYIVNVTICLISYSMLDFKDNLIKVRKNDGLVNVTLEDKLYTLNYDKKDAFEPTSALKPYLTNIDMSNFEMLINILLPLFFGACLAKYTTARDAYLGFVGEVEFMAIYFITLTTTKKFVPGKLRFQLKKIKILLAAMPTAVYELVKDHFYGSQAPTVYLLYDRTESIEFPICSTSPKKPPNDYDEMSYDLMNVECGRHCICTRKSRDKYYLNIASDPLKKAIFQDIDKLHKDTGLGVFECMLHMLMGYIDKIKVDESGYNTSIERDFIVKWNHINSGWGKLFNNVTYDTPILIDLMLRFTLLIYAWYRPRSFESCETNTCSTFFAGALFNVCIYATIYFAGEVLQDPFQSWHINPSVRKDAYDTQDHVNKLFDLFDKKCDVVKNEEDNQWSGIDNCPEPYNFTYNDGFKGKNDERLIDLRKYMPIGIYEISKFMVEHNDVFKYSKTYSRTSILDWDDITSIMTDVNDWDDNFKKKFARYTSCRTEQRPLRKGCNDYIKDQDAETIEINNNDNELNGRNKEKQETLRNMEFLKQSLKSEDYYALLLSVYCSDNVRKHLNQLSYSYFEFDNAKAAIKSYINNLKPTETVGGIKKFTVNKRCKKGVNKTVIEYIKEQNTNGKDFRNNDDIFGGCNNDGNEEVRASDASYIEYIQFIFEKIFKKVNKKYTDGRSNDKKSQQVSRLKNTASLFQHKIDIMSNTNSSKGLKYL